MGKHRKTPPPAKHQKVEGGAFAFSKNRDHEPRHGETEAEELKANRERQARHAKEEESK